MSENPARIIEEYLELVREKLPESIADDVITELETYMMETASELGEEGQITIASAKKVVAQFGAPGEVADEYRFSMFPETIPEKDIPPEIIQQPQAIEPSSIESQQPLQVSRRVGEDPTSSPVGFFIKASILSIFWMIFAAIPSTFLGPLGYLSWMSSIFLAPTFIVFILIGGFMLLAFDHKWQRTILWKRSYPEWSQLQVFVTLPENSIPASRLEYRVVDIFLSLCGILLFAPYVIQVYNGIFSLLLAIPALILFFARIYLIGKKMSEKRDPLELAKYEFVCNFSLLVILNASFGWVFVTQLTSTSLQIYLRPLHAIYVILFGVVLLFNLITGAQNLWWESEKDDDRQTAQIIREDDSVELVDRFANIAKRLFTRIIGWVIFYNIFQIYMSIIITSPYEFYLMTGTLALLFIQVFVGGILLGIYMITRYFLMTKRKFVRIIGQRTRGEALIDIVASSLMLVAVCVMLAISLDNFPSWNMRYYQEVLYSLQLGFLVALGEFIPFVLGAFGLTFRMIGDILEFVGSWKRKATRYIEQSNILLLVGLTIFATVEYFKGTAIFHWYNFATWFLFPIVLLLAFQVATSSVKLSETQKEKQPVIPSQKRVNTSISNS